MANFISLPRTAQIAITLLIVATCAILVWVFAGTGTATTTALIFLLVFIFLTALAFVLLKPVITPQDREGTLEGNRGEEKSDFPNHFDIPAEEEIDSLDHSYDKMVDLLGKVNELEKEYTRTLEQEVEKRTYEIRTQNEELKKTSEKLKLEIIERKRAEAELQKAHDELEIRVRERTAELAHSNEQLEKEIKERKRAEAQIRQLSSRLIDGIEEEQKRLARDLHDEFGQFLTAIYLGVETLLASLPEDFERQRENAVHLMGLIEKLGDKIRNITSELRPDLLDDLGLVPALEWYIKEFLSQRKDINIEFQAIGFRKRLSSDLELIFYRIFQEGLNNIVKHAQANHLQVTLTYNYPKVILVMKDNGIGFDQEQKTDGIGLIGMRERVVSVKGQIEIRSPIGKGTTIRVELPIAIRNKDEEHNKD